MQRLEPDQDASLGEYFCDVLAIDAVADGCLAVFKRRWRSLCASSNTVLPVRFFDSDDLNADCLSSFSKYQSNEQWTILIIASCSVSATTFEALETNLKFLARNVCVLLAIVDDGGRMLGDALPLPMPEGYRRLVLGDSGASESVVVDQLAQAYFSLLKATCEQNVICVDVVDFAWVCSRSDYLFYYRIFGVDIADIARQARRCIESCNPLSVFLCINSAGQVSLGNFTELLDSLEEVMHEDALEVGTIIELDCDLSLPISVDFFFGIDDQE